MSLWQPQPCPMSQTHVLERSWEQELTTGIAWTPLPQLLNTGQLYGLKHWSPTFLAPAWVLWKTIFPWKAVVVQTIMQAMRVPLTSSWAAWFLTGCAPGAGESEKCQLLSCIGLLGDPWTVAHQAPLTMEFSRQEHPGLRCRPLHPEKKTGSFGKRVEWWASLLWQALG